MLDDAVPQDGDPITSDDVPVGHITSARLSPTLGKGIGLAWVPKCLAENGTKITIVNERRKRYAKVKSDSFYDPEGRRLKE